MVVYQLGPVSPCLWSPWRPSHHYCLGAFDSVTKPPRDIPTPALSTLPLRDVICVLEEMQS